MRDFPGSWLVQFIGAMALIVGLAIAGGRCRAHAFPVYEILNHGVPDSEQEAMVGRLPYRAIEWSRQFFACFTFDAKDSFTMQMQRTGEAVMTDARRRKFEATVSAQDYGCMCWLLDERDGIDVMALDGRTSFGGWSYTVNVWPTFGNGYRTERGIDLAKTNLIREISDEFDRIRDTLDWKPVKPVKPDRSQD